MVAVLTVTIAIIVRKQVFCPQKSSGNAGFVKFLISRFKILKKFMEPGCFLQLRFIIVSLFCQFLTQLSEANSPKPMAS